MKTLFKALRRYCRMNKNIWWYSIFVLYYYDETFGLTCYSCNDVKTNEQCLNVVKCPQEELCYGRADGLLTTGGVMHTTGCTKEHAALKRNGTSGITFCAHSCNSSLCNLYQCSAENVTRAPRCLTCDMVRHPEDCTNITQCSSDEVCYAQKFLTFGNIRYRLGCIPKQHCDSRQVQVSTLFGKRSTLPDNCSVCCANDHCNIDACSKPSSQMVSKLNSMSPGAPCTDTDASTCAVLGRLNPESCREAFVVKTCPKSCGTCEHAGWSPWSSWAPCTRTCDKGSQTRSRSCTHRVETAVDQHCFGYPEETKLCFLRHCPVNGGWCYRDVVAPYCCSSCLCSGTVTTKTTCSCPKPAYGGRSCN